MVVVALVVYCARVVAPWFAFSPPETLPIQELFRIKSVLVESRVCSVLPAISFR